MNARQINGQTDNRKQTNKQISISFHLQIYYYLYISDNAVILVRQCHRVNYMCLLEIMKEN